MTRRTLQVQHPGSHAPSPSQVAAALRSALHADGLARDGDYIVRSYSHRSGGPSTVVVDVPTKPAAGAETDFPPIDLTEEEADGG